MNIETFIHKFKIGTHEVRLSIQCTDGHWECSSLDKDWGSSGGSYKNLDEYVRHVEMAYTYQYNFFNHGYDYAKKNIKIREL